MALTQEQIKQGYSTIPGNFNPLNGNVITPSALQPVAPVATVPTPQDNTNYAGITGGVTESIAKEYERLNALTQEGEKSQSSTGSDLLSLMQDISGKTSFAQGANETAGVNTAIADQNKYAQQLADLNAQATSLNREAQAVPIQVQQNALAGSTRGGNAPVNADLLRANALKALSIAQQSDVAAAALTGSTIRLEAAKDKAQQMVDLEFKPKEDRLAILQKQYDLNKDILESYDKKRAEALAVTLKKEETKLAEDKAKAKAIEDMIVTATPNAPAEIIANAKAIKDKGGSSLEVAQALGKYGGDYLKTELLKQQIETEKVQRSKFNADIRQTNANIDKIKAETGLGADGKPLKALSGEASKLLSTSSGLEKDIQRIKDKINKVGYEAFLRGNILGTDRETVKLLANAADKIGRLRSGGAINKDEETRFMAQFSSKGDYAFGSADIAIEALDSIGTEAKTVASSIDPQGLYRANVPTNQSVASDPSNNKFGQAVGVLAPVNYTTANMSVKPDGSLDWTLPTNPTKK